MKREKKTRKKRKQKYINKHKRKKKTDPVTYESKTTK